MSGLSDRYRRAKRHLPAGVPQLMHKARGARRANPAGLRPWDPRERALPPEPLRSAEVTDAAYARLDPEDVEHVRGRLAPETLGLVDAADPAEARRLILSFAIHQEIAPLMDKIRWGGALQPPEHVHAMARGPLAGAGAYFYADLVAEALREAGADPAEPARALDFGCSSGRVVRALMSAWPGHEWHGCDPNAGAIAWANEHLPGLGFAQSPQHPPLPYEDGAFDWVFAISIWSHFGPDAAGAWLEEMHRVIRPGGHLVLTTHGFHSLAYYAREGTRQIAQLSRIGASLYRDGFWYAADFGEEGDWGVKDPQWGSAFMTLEWLLGRVRGTWRLMHHARGQADGNQDVIVLRREPAPRPFDPRIRPPAAGRLPRHEVTDALYERLDEADVAEVVERMEPELQRSYDAVEPHTQRAFVLALGLHYGAGGIETKTGLSPVLPPDDVHAMARGPLTTGGDYWYADLVVHALRIGGVDPATARRALDFGSSSGRVLRPLAAVYKGIEWHGCDPNRAAIEWAGANLAPARFRVSPERPPLPYDDAAFDFAYAISIWSHFAKRPALEWLDEMRRVIRPGGHLILTTHGAASIAYYAGTRERTLEQLSEIGEALYRDGFWYAPEFGAEGDWGVVNPEWGTAYMSLEWLAERVLPAWELVGFRSAQVAANQDLLVLRRPGS